jgi:hypothetical protein
VLRKMGGVLCVQFLIISYNRYENLFLKENLFLFTAVLNKPT